MKEIFVLLEKISKLEKEEQDLNKKMKVYFEGSENPVFVDDGIGNRYKRKSIQEKIQEHCSQLACIPDFMDKLKCCNIILQIKTNQKFDMDFALPNDEYAKKVLSADAYEVYHNIIDITPCDKRNIDKNGFLRFYFSCNEQQSNNICNAVYSLISLLFDDGSVSLKKQYTEWTLDGLNDWAGIDEWINKYTLE